MSHDRRNGTRATRGPRDSTLSPERDGRTDGRRAAVADERGSRRGRAHYIVSNRPNGDARGGRVEGRAGALGSGLRGQLPPTKIDVEVDAVTRGVERVAMDDHDDVDGGDTARRARAVTASVVGDDGGDGDAAAGYFSVLARWTKGADVGPVTIEASDGTVGALKRALYDAPWRLRERGVGTTEEEVEKPAGPGNLRVLANGRVAGPDSKSLVELGMSPDGTTRVVHMVVSARESSWSETQAMEHGWNKEEAHGGQPRCCSMM